MRIVATRLPSLPERGAPLDLGARRGLIPLEEAGVDLAVRAAAGAAQFQWALGRASPHCPLGLTFLYPLVLIARAALIGEAGGIDFGGFLTVLQLSAFLNALINTGLIALAATAGCCLGRDAGADPGVRSVSRAGDFVRRGSSTRSSPCRPSW